jgi:catechol 2,3-dioxygenase-like lactoylglutathione lyase family enzyme
MPKITANLIVDSIEASLPFWVERLGFTRTVEVPEGDALGFVILHRGALEVMLQSRASVAKDVPPLAAGPHHATLYVEVDDLGPIRKALDGWPTVVPERTTAYGARELIVRDPGGHVVFFAAHERLSVEARLAIPVHIMARHVEPRRGPAGGAPRRR